MRRRCFYSVIHYIPSLVRGEFINIGVVLQCGKGTAVHCRVLDRIDKITRFDRQADPKVINALLAELKRQLDSFPLEDIADENFLHALSEGYSNHIQLTPPRICLVDDLESELHHLYELFVADDR